MQLVCINSNHLNNLTYGKVYIPITYFKDFKGELVYVIQCDDGEVDDLPDCLFIDIEKWRENRINRLKV